MKKSVASVFLAAVVLVGSWVVAAASRREVLPLGSAAPSFVFATVQGRATFRPSPHRTLLILFHSRCAHCNYEFDALEPHLDRLAGTELFLLTTEDSLNMAAIERRWPRLARSEHVTWGTADRAIFAHHFGTVMTPALFLFDATGRLAGKWLGETKLEVQGSHAAHSLSQPVRALHLRVRRARATPRSAGWHGVVPAHDGRLVEHGSD